MATSTKESLFRTSVSPVLGSEFNFNEGYQGILTGLRFEYFDAPIDEGEEFPVWDGPSVFAEGAINPEDFYKFQVTTGILNEARVFNIGMAYGAGAQLRSLQDEEQKNTDLNTGIVGLGRIGYWPLGAYLELRASCFPVADQNKMTIGAYAMLDLIKVGYLALSNL